MFEFRNSYIHTFIFIYTYISNSTTDYMFSYAINYGTEKNIWKYFKTLIKKKLLTTKKYPICWFTLVITGNRTRFTDLQRGNIPLALKLNSMHIHKYVHNLLFMYPRVVLNSWYSIELTPFGEMLSVYPCYCFVLIR